MRFFYEISPKKGENKPYSSFYFCLKNQKHFKEMKKLIILVLLTILTISCSQDNNEVIEKPTFVASENPLDFGTVTTYTRLRKSLTITNEGDADLIITGMELENNPVFYGSPFPDEEVIIEPKSFYSFAFLFDAIKEGNFESELTFYTNIGEQKVTLKGIRLGTPPPL